MLDRGVLSRLFVLTAKDSFTLTLYVDIDQNKQANRRRGFKVQAEALVKAGLYDDAETVYNRLLAITSNTSRKAMIEQELQQIYLLRTASGKRRQAGKS